MKSKLTSHFTLRSGILSLAFSLGWTVCGAQAATITLNADIPSGQNWDSTSGGLTYWSDGLAVHAGDDYVVSGVRLLRTTGTGSTFLGDSLTLAGQFNLTATSGNQTWTINNLNLSPGGVIVSASSDNSIQSLSGSISVSSGTAFIKSTGNTGSGNTRNITINSIVSGGSGATLHFLRQGTFSLTNASNIFGGTWMAGGSATISGAANASVSNFTNQFSVIKATTAGSLGIDASVTLDAWGRLDADFDWTTTGTLTLNANGQLLFDQNFTVGSMFIGGDQIAAGTYTLSNFTAMNASYASYFTGGTGVETVTVVPEPTSHWLLSLAAGAVLMLRRKRR